MRGHAASNPRRANLNKTAWLNFSARLATLALPISPERQFKILSSLLARSKEVGSVRPSGQLTSIPLVMLYSLMVLEVGSLISIF